MSGKEKVSERERGKDILYRVDSKGKLGSGLPVIGSQLIGQ